MKKLIFAAVALLFAACTTEQTADIMPSASKVLTVSFEEESRIQLNGEQKAVWTKDDLVSVFYQSDANQQWMFEGDTGATTATLVNVTEPASTKELSKVVAIYPYNEGYTISEDCKVTATLPTEQSYLADSYGLNGNIMVSYGEGDILKMRSVLGWLKLQLTGDGEVVKSITLTGNDSEQIAGGVVIDPSDLSLELNDPTSTTLTLNCDEGVTLSEEVTTFYIGIPPQTFEEGFTAKIYCLDDKVMTKSTTNSVEIKRNTIKPMDELTYQADVPYNQIWYTAVAKVEPNSNAFNVTIKSNEWDETTGKGVITFNGDLTEIGEEAFINCTRLTTITIPDSVILIGDWVFCFCDRLKSVIIPNSVTKIGEAAFMNCTNLTSVTIGNSVTEIGEAAFMNCSRLTSVTIPNSVTILGINPFYSCSNLAEFNGKFASVDKRCLIVDGVLNSFAIGCGYTEYTIPSGVISIGDYSFYSCSSLTSVTILDNVTSIGAEAFYACRRLASVYCKPTTPPTSNNKMFAYNANGRKIYVPRASESAYEAASYWSDYASDIEPYDFN